MQEKVENILQLTYNNTKNSIALKGSTLLTILWILLIIVDLIIVGLLTLLCMVALRQKPNDITTRNLEKGSQLEHLKQTILESKLFFEKHPGEPLLIRSRDTDLYARRYPQNNPKGRIIMMHGYRSIAENDFGPVIDFYYSMGYELILVDQRAHGKSSGIWIGFGVLERHDCKAWIEYLNDRFGAIPTFLSGISMGCTTVLMATQLHLPQNVCGIIADCGFTSPNEIIIHVMKRKLKLPLRFLITPLNWFCKIFAGYCFDECTAVEALKENEIPVFFLHGKADRFVPCEMTLENHRACTAPKELLLVDGAGHGTSYLQDKESVEQAIRIFLSKYNPIK